VGRARAPAGAREGRRSRRISRLSLGGTRRAEAPRPLGIFADGLGFRYAGAERSAIQDVAFELEPGRLLLVVGPSGSGKSTLARAIAGLVPRDFPGQWHGSLRIGEGSAGPGDSGAAVSDPGAVGIVFQDPESQLVMERAGDDVAFGLENRAWPLAAMRARVPEALAEVGLAGFERRHSNRLSGGEQQRLALAGVLAPRPGVLVLDEPSANLDPDGAAALFARLAELRAGGSTTIVLVEHRVDRAWPLADLVVALGGDGRPIDVGEPAAVLARSGGTMRTAGIWLPEDLDVATGRRPSRPRSGGRSGEPPIPRSAGSKVLRLHEARYAFDGVAPAVRDIDLAIKAGERVALTGPNGSGKSTLLRLAIGLLRPGAGWVDLAGEDPARMKPERIASLAGYVVQDPELGFLADTVAEEIAIGLDAAQQAHATELADRLSLPLAAFGDRSPYRLSGGEQRRLSLVTALARRPALLALDEPTFGQDRHGHEALVAAIAELVGEGTAMLAATHDERFVRDAARRRVELAEGWIVADEPVA
jgi:energy-coupling factor transporter ATP-binding protein EcfA2